MRCMLIGNYGTDNVGDEALHAYFLKTFPEVTWVTVSANPKVDEMPRLPTGIRSFFGTRWWRTLGAMRQCDAVVFGGGSLFTDVESILAPVLWGVHACAAFCFGKRVFLVSQGIGPLRNVLSRIITRAVLRRATFVSVRDEASKEAAEKLGRADVLLSADPVLLLIGGAAAFGQTPHLTVIPRSEVSQPFVTAVTGHRGFDHDYPVTIVLMQPKNPAEREMAERLRVMLPKSTLYEATGIEELLTALQGSEHVISARYHGALLAFALGIPLSIVSQGKSDKLDALDTFIRSNGSRETLLTRAREGERILREKLLKKN